MCQYLMIGFDTKNGGSSVIDLCRGLLLNCVSQRQCVSSSRSLKYNIILMINYVHNIICCNVMSFSLNHKIYHNVND